MGHGLMKKQQAYCQHARVPQQIQNPPNVPIYPLNCPIVLRYLFQQSTCWNQGISPTRCELDPRVIDFGVGPVGFTVSNKMRAIPDMMRVRCLRLKIERLALFQVFQEILKVINRVTNQWWITFRFARLLSSQSFQPFSVYFGLKSKGTGGVL